jgi:CRISPR/Cas system Type II protein with McrA/HNH and RuvC-like nuclease domain
VSFPKKLVSGLGERQAGKCFYCASSIAKDAEVDHFVPWSKFPNDAIENLVLACKKCNGKKSDYLCVPQFVERWLSRPDEELARIATTSHWDTDPRRSRAIAANIYGSLVAGSVVWAGGEDFVEIDDSVLRSFLVLFGINT